MAQHKRRGRLEVLRREVAAELRQEDRDKRSDLEQAQLLVNRPGHSFRETARLAEKI
jgi:hypothetical protein